MRHLLSILAAVAAAAACGQPAQPDAATDSGSYATETLETPTEPGATPMAPLRYVDVTKEAGIDYGVGKFPWAASGRALGNGRSEGFTKLLFDNSTNQIIGAGIVGTHAGDLIAECGLAIEMGCEAADIGLTIHPHPTLSESIGMAAEVFEGTITDLYIPKRK